MKIIKNITLFIRIIRYDGLTFFYFKYYLNYNFFIILFNFFIYQMFIQHLFSQAGAIPLEKLILREKAGENSRAIYLIHSKNEAEMFEFECQEPKNKRIWLESIRVAIDQCPEEGELDDNSNKASSLQEMDNEKVKELLSKYIEVEILVCNVSYNLGKVIVLFIIYLKNI